MEIYLIILIAAVSLALLFFLATLVCFLLVFYSPKRAPLTPDEYEIPKGDAYKPFIESIINWTDGIRNMPREDVSITSFDGLTLRGKYYEYEKGAPIELMFHGYRGSAERDLCGGVHRCFSLGRNALIVDHRAAGESDGRIITFGIKERIDCIDWINYAAERFGEDAKIIITGISMGAAAVMMALSEDLPKNVIGAIADCGYTSPREIIKKVMRDIHVPPSVFYPIVKLGAKIFGGFNLEETSAVEGVKKCKIPIIFIHGESDTFVPCDMSIKLYNLCTSPRKKLYTLPDTEHGLAYPKGPEGYYRVICEFDKECGSDFAK